MLRHPIIMGKTRAVFIVLVVFSIMLFTACTESKTNKKEVSFEELTKKIIENIDVDSLEKGDEAKLSKFYDIDSSDVESYMVYTPPSNIKADQLVVLEAKDTDSVDTLKEKLTTKIDEMSEAFKDYLPEEYFLLDKHVLKSNNKYILLVVSEKADRVEEAFDSLF